MACAQPNDQDGSVVQPSAETGNVKLVLSSFAYKRKAPAQVRIIPCYIRACKLGSNQ